MRASDTVDDIMVHIAFWKLEFEPETSYAKSLQMLVFQDG
jgi:hypothetical protein